MTCYHNHSDPNDNPSSLHIASCYRAFEIYYDPDGLVTETEFAAKPTNEWVAEIDRCFPVAVYDGDAEPYDD